MSTLRNKLSCMLDKSINELEQAKGNAISDRDRVKLEAAALTEALGKSKQALAEVQIQRGKLNNIIAKMAQKKSELIREKVAMSTEMTKLQESLHVAE